MTSENYAMLGSTKTPKFKFPVKVAVEYKWGKLNFRVTFTENGGQQFTTEWLWNHEFFDSNNEKNIGIKLKTAEDYIDQEAKSAIHKSLMESRRKEMREQNVEAKINRLFDRY